MKRDLTDAWLRALEPPAAGRLEVRDARVPGLVLRMTPNGAASWSVRAVTREGKHTRPRLGTWPAMGVAAARREALRAVVAIQGGSDPVGDRWAARAARKRREAEAEAAAAETVAARLAEWRDARAADPASPWSPRYAAEVRRVCDQAILPALGGRALASTTREDWTRLVADRRRALAKGAPRAAGADGKRRAGAPARGGAGAAAFLYRTASAFLNHAEAHGWIPAPLLPRRGASRIAPPPPPRARVLTDAELAAVWRAADREPPKLRVFVRLLILTGAREAEVADMAARELDMDAGRWAIPGDRTKNGVGYTVPLSALALSELRAVLPAAAGADRAAGAAFGGRFLGRLAGSGFKGFGKLKARVDAASGVAGWRWHDLRRTARTGMTRLGVPRDHAEAAINHVSGRSKLERTYDRHDYAPEVTTARFRPGEAASAG